jgi:hypothetical protein
MQRILMIAILIAAAHDVRSQSLGEAAAKEKERRAKIEKSPKTSKTLTESDLQEAGNKRAREGSPSSAVSPSPATAVAKATPPSPDPSVASDANTIGESKKARAAELRARMAETIPALKKAEEDLKLAEDNWRMVNGNPFVANRSLGVDADGSVDSARALLDKAQKRVAALKQQRDDIDDTARREGISQQQYLP